MGSTFNKATIYHFCFNITLLSWSLSSFFGFGYDLIISFLNSLLRIFKKHLSLNAILGHNFFSYPKIFLQFFLVALGIYLDSLVLFLFGYLLFHRFVHKMAKCPLLYFVCTSFVYLSYWQVIFNLVFVLKMSTFHF